MTEPDNCIHIVTIKPNLDATHKLKRQLKDTFRKALGSLSTHEPTFNNFLSMTALANLADLEAIHQWLYDHQTVGEDKGLADAYAEYDTENYQVFVKFADPSKAMMFKLAQGGK